MANLPEEAQRLIVMELAMFTTPTEVVERVSQELGITISRQQAHKYNPTGSNGYKVGKKWKALFAETRKQFLADTSSIPIANRAVRLKALNDMAQGAKGRGNFALAAQLMEQAAKECGDVFTNRREVTGKDGGPIETRRLSPEENRKRVFELVNKLGLDKREVEGHA